MNTEKTMNVSIIFVMVTFSIFFIVLIYGLINSIHNEVSKPLEYSYKNFSEHDIELAMKFNGCLSVTLTETEAYFVRDNAKCNLFNDATIKYLYENRQKEVKNGK